MENKRHKIMENSRYRFVKRTKKREMRHFDEIHKQQSKILQTRNYKYKYYSYLNYMLPVEMKIRKNKISSVRLNQIHLIVYRTSAGRVMAYQK